MSVAIAKRSKKWYIRYIGRASPRRANGKEKHKTMRKARTRIIWRSTMIGLLAFFLTGCLCIFELVSQYKSSMEDARSIANLQKERIEHTINDRLLALSSLEALAIRDNGELENFQKIAPMIVGGDPCVRCVQFAKGGVITKESIYPYEPREDGKDGTGNLLSPNSPRYEQALEVLEKRTTILSIPAEGKLHQGGSGPIARRAVFLTDDEGNEVFWGFTVIIMDFPALLKQVGVSELDRNYVYRLAANDAVGNAFLIAGNAEMPHDAMNFDIELPGASWQFSLVPIGGWVAISTVTAYAIATILTSLLSFAATFFFMRSSEYLRRYKHLSQRDYLTKTYNPRAFYERMKKYAEGDRSFALYLLDVDKFKAINDTYGHSVGDKLLMQIASNLQKHMPEHAEAYRIGGDEFAVVHFTDKHDDFCAEVRKKLTDACSIPFDSKGSIMHVSVSCGYALYPQDATTVDGLVQTADTFMYRQKQMNSKSFPLSGRVHFLRTIGYYIRSDREKGETGIYYFLHMDYKNFKYINYHFGIESGDALIEHTIEHIRAHPNCLVCGRGTSDHIFFLIRTKPETSRDEVERQFGEYIRMFTAKEEERYPGCVLNVWCGYARVLLHQIENAVGRANLGRVLAKEKRILHPVFVDEAQAMRYMADGRIEQEILLALRDGRVFYHLQPQMEVKSGAIISCEVLGRMKNREGVLISPARFIPILEETGDIVRFDLLILETACRDLRARLDAGKKVVPLSINLSRVHVMSEGSAEKIKTIIDRYAVPHDMLCFEITETFCQVQGQALSRFCQELHDIGVKVSFDDFGAGETGIHLIRDAHIDELKLDKTFLLCSPEATDRQSEIIGQLVALTKKLNIRLVCEGVENTRHFEQIKRAGVEYVQGFYYAKPDRHETIYDQFLS